MQASTVVGYSTTSLLDGFKAVSVPFNKIGKVVDGKKGVNLSDIIPEGADVITGDVQLQLLDTEGCADGGIIYACHKNDPATDRYGKPRYPNNGWYSGNTYITPDSDDDLFITEGMGVWVEGTTSFNFKPSGEVQMDTLNTDLVDGFRLVGNPYPTTVRISAFVPKGADVITGDVQLQLLDIEGCAEGGIVYAYHKDDPATDRYGKPRYPNNGWYSGNTYIAPNSDDDVEVASGSAVWVEGTVDFTMDVVTPFEDL